MYSKAVRNIPKSKKSQPITNVIWVRSFQVPKTEAFLKLIRLHRIIHNPVKVISFCMTGKATKMNRPVMKPNIISFIERVNKMNIS